MRTIIAPIRWLTTRPALHSLRIRLMLLVLLASLPSLILLFITAQQQQDDAIAAGRNEASRIARLATTDQRNVVDNISLAISSIANQPEVVGNDRSACAQTMQNLTATSVDDSSGVTVGTIRIENATLRRIMVVEETGSVFCTSRTGDSVSPLSDADVVERAFNSTRTAMGHHRIDPATGTYIQSFAQAFPREDGTGDRVLLAHVEIYALGVFASQANLVDGTFLVVFDNSGVLLQRFPATVGPDPGTLIAATPVVGLALGTVRDEDLPDEEFEVDGEAFVHAEEEIRYSGSVITTDRMYVLVAIPGSAIGERADAVLRENLGKLAIAALVAMVAAWIGADLFVARDGEARKGVIRDLYHAFGTGDAQGLDDWIGPNYVDRTPSPGQTHGIDGVRQNIAAFHAAFPEGEIIPRELLADSDKVVARVTLTGTHMADYFGMPPSNREMTAEGVETFRFAHGMIVESWSLFGPLGPLAQRTEAQTNAPPPRPGFLRRLFSRGDRRQAAEGGS